MSDALNRIPKKRWNGKTFEVNEALDTFLKEIDDVCKKHNLSISHQNTDGEFIVEEYKDSNRATLENALFIGNRDKITLLPGIKPVYRLEGLIQIKTTHNQKGSTWIRFSGFYQNQGMVTLNDSPLPDTTVFQVFGKRRPNTTWETRIRKGLEERSLTPFLNQRDTVQENVLFVVDKLLAANIIRDGEVFHYQGIDKYKMNAELYIQFFRD